MLYQISNTYKDGYVEDLISTTPTTKQDCIEGSIVSVFRYEITSLMKPCLVTFSGQRYIMPGWIKCHPNTELNDVIHIKPVSKNILPAKEKKTEFEFMSSNGKDKYFVRVIGESMKCSCPGYWRADKLKGCKHIQEVRKYEK
jgi:hypothetical protein